MVVTVKELLPKMVARVKAAIGCSAYGSCNFDIQARCKVAARYALRFLTTTQRQNLADGEHVEIPENFLAEAFRTNDAE